MLRIVFLSSLLLSPTQLYFEGIQKRWHFHSSLQSTYTFKTLKQTAKARTLCVYKLLWSRQIYLFIYLFIYLLIRHFWVPLTPMTSGQLYIVYNCSNLNKISLSNAMICRIEQKSFQFLFEKLGVRDQSNVNGQAIPRSWCSDGERSLTLWWDQSRTRNNQIVSPSWAERGASWDVGYGSNQFGQIRRCTTIDCMVYQKAEFELNSLCNW